MSLYLNFWFVCRNIESSLGVEILGAAAADEYEDEDEIADETDRFR